MTLRGLRYGTILLLALFLFMEISSSVESLRSFGHGGIFASVLHLLGKLFNLGVIVGCLWFTLRDRTTISPLGLLGLLFGFCFLSLFRVLEELYSSAIFSSIIKVETVLGLLFQIFLISKNRSILTSLSSYITV